MPRPVFRPQACAKAPRRINDILTIEATVTTWAAATHAHTIEPAFILSR